MSHLYTKLVSISTEILETATPDIEDRLGRIETALVVMNCAENCLMSNLGTVPGERWVDTRPSVKQLIEAALLSVGEVVS